MTHNTQRILQVNTSYISAVGTFPTDMDTSKEAIGRRLEEARKAAGLEREDVAKQFGDGFSVSTIQAHENGRNEPSIAKLERYARRYKVSLLWLVSGAKSAEEAAQSIDAEALSDAIFSAALAHAEGSSMTEQRLEALAKHAATVYERLTGSSREKTG